MMRGGKPKHTNVVALTGRGSTSQPPAWLSTGAKREWGRAAADLARRGILFDGALASLATYCTLVDQIEQLSRIVAKEGLITEDGLTHPAQRMLLATAAQTRMLAAELGLSVVSRTRSFQGKSSDEQAWDELEVG
jgi:P27 family predicted phage terminase small subunit